jgi:acyl carrier protein
MNEMEVYERMIPIFQDVFDDDTLTIQASTSASDVDGWDSLAHIRLIVALEQAFQVRFRASEVSSFQRVADVVAAIIAKGAK